MSYVYICHTDTLAGLCQCIFDLFVEAMANHGMLGLGTKNGGDIFQSCSYIIEI